MVMQRIEGVEESLLRRVFTLQKLNVVDEKDVNFSVTNLEFGCSVVGNGVNEVVGEFFRTYVANS